MLEIPIPGGPMLRFAHLVADFNGTLAVDGELIAGVAEALRTLAAALDIHVVTADTFGRLKQAMAGVPCATTILPPGDQDSAKLQYVQRLGASSCVCIGNGRNDRLMLAAAGLGIAVIQGEGAAVDALLSAKIVTLNIGVALGLLLNPERLVATLRL
jgi:soluble P-type ATPase